MLQFLSWTLLHLELKKMDENKHLTFKKLVEDDFKLPYL
jgi:hypothetical protein